MTSLTKSTLCLLPVLLLVGCDSEDETRPPQIGLNIVNAAPGFENLAVRRGTTNLAQIGSFDYAGRTTTRFDSGIYSYTVETFDSPNQSVIVQATFTDEVEEGQQHFYVFAEQNGSVLPLTFSRPVFDSSNADWELSIVNAVESAPDLDIYVLPTGTDITTVAPIGSVQFGQLLDGGTLQPGSYEFTLTEPGNSNSVLFVSNEIELTAGLSVEVTIAPDINGAENRMTLIGTTVGNSFTLVDSTAPTSVRFLNGAADELARDFYLDGDFTTPFAGNVEFAALSDYMNLPQGTSQISVTPAGNPSVVEDELTDALFVGALHDIVVAGPAGNVSALAVLDNRVRNNLHARLQFMNAASTYEDLLVYVLAPGTDITTVLPNIALAVGPATSPRTLIQAQTFELTVTDAVSTNVVFGPVNISLAERGLYTVLFYDSGDGTTVNALLLDDFQ